MMQLDEEASEPKKVSYSSKFPAPTGLENPSLRSGCIVLRVVTVKGGETVGVFGELSWAV